VFQNNSTHGKKLVKKLASAPSRSGLLILACPWWFQGVTCNICLRGWIAVHHFLHLFLFRIGIAIPQVVCSWSNNTMYAYDVRMPFSDLDATSGKR